MRIADTPETSAKNIHQRLPGKILGKVPGRIYGVTSEEIPKILPPEEIFVDFFWKIHVSISEFISGEMSMTISMIDLLKLLFTPLLQKGTNTVIARSSHYLY